MNKKAFLFLFQFMIAISLPAQKPAKELKYFEQKYPNSSSVDVLSKQRLDINMVDGKPEIYFELYSESIILTDVVSEFTNKEIYYSPVDPLLSVEAWSLIPDGNKYKKIPVKNFTHKSAVDDVFFNDVRTCNFVFTGLTKGSKIVYKYRRKINDLYALPRLFLSSTDGVEYVEAMIEYDNLVNLKFNYFGFQPESNSFSVNKGKKKTNMRIVMQSLPKMKFEKNVVSYAPYVMHIIPRIAYYKTSIHGDSVAVLPDLNHLYKYNRSNIDNIAKSDDAKLSILADSITSQLSGELDKVKAIYYWVQHNIHYIAIEDGDNGVVPADALYVYEKRYGDCKGMSNLIYTLLKKLGINAYYTWVGTKKIPYKYTEIPSPFTDNHMIVTYIDETGNYYFLDGTSEFQSIEIAPGLIQGKECLISIDRDSFQIKEIPYSTGKIFSTTRMKIQNLDLKIDETEQLYGNIAWKSASYFAHKTEEMKRQLFLNQLKSEGYAKSTLTKVQHSDLYEVDKELEIKAQYTLNDYIVRSNTKLYVKPFLRGLEPIIIEPDRKYEFEFNQKTHYKWIQEIQIPDQYTVEQLPENISYFNPLFSFSSKLTHKEDTVYVEVECRTDFVRLPKSEYQSWNEMNQIIQNFCNQSFVFKQK